MEIRQLQPFDAREFKKIRLRGLKESPYAFASSWEDEVKHELEAVAQRLAGDAATGSFVLGAFEEDGSLIGVAGLYRDTKEKLRHKGTVWGVYVVPERREKGIARSLLQVLLEKVRNQTDITQVLLRVATSNTAARDLYLSLGFKTYGTEPRALNCGGQFLDEDLMLLAIR